MRLTNRCQTSPQPPADNNFLQRLDEKCVWPKMTKYGNLGPGHQKFENFKPLC